MNLAASALSSLCECQRVAGNDGRFSNIGMTSAVDNNRKDDNGCYDNDDGKEDVKHFVHRVSDAFPSDDLISGDVIC